ncbi:hypothetical protein CPB83DRAFT_760449 [Crepidotus variabilis]|uniref:Uncharacterized protein n=1 Tax=Crepidotus variabilis TaxID=179855 RepID=A0A9P6EMT3_9AGAR|nr:hypothetical protein CPB83DRAFT_760449 [Crepidotus variabilis]
MSACTNQRAESLKAEGNALFQAGEWRPAYHKYSDAIKEDPKNAVYYANRSACSLSLKERRNLTPNTRRHGLGLPLLDASIEAWNEALKCLPQTGELSEADKRLKIQFEEGLAKVKKAEAAENDPQMRTLKSTDKVPWKCAEEHIEQLRADKVQSSASLNCLFSSGIHERSHDHERSPPETNERTDGLDWEARCESKERLFTPKSTDLQALVDMSNGLMRDNRVFHLDSNDWIQKYNTQVMFECQYFDAWKDAGPKTVIEEAPKKVQKEGWDKTRNALATTVRHVAKSWMMCGFLATATQKLTVAVEYHTRVMEVLKWGSQAWADISLLDRGCIFEQTFIRGAKRLHIMAIHEALASKSGCQYTVDDLKDMCTDLVANIHGNPPNPVDISQVDPGFYLSFWVYPHAEALAILGWCHTQHGLKATNAKDFVAAFTKAAELYDEACSIFPEDDEKVATFLAANLESYAFSNKPWVDMKGLFKRMHSSMVKMMRFWVHSQISAPRNRRLADMDEFFGQCVKLEKEGRITDSSIVKPIEIVSDSFFFPS